MFTTVLWPPNPKTTLHNLRGPDKQTTEQIRQNNKYED